MPAVNVVMMLGNLTRDPQLTYTPSQTAVCDFGLAINRKWTKADGTKGEAVCFIDVRCFGTTAENVTKYMTKGALVFVEGHLDFQRWEKDGETRSKHVLICDRAQFMPHGEKDKPADSTKPVPDSDIPF